jgi:hypothetical protein
MFGACIPLSRRFRSFGHGSAHEIVAESGIAIAYSPRLAATVMSGA